MAIIYVTYGCNFSCNGCLCNQFNAEKVFMDFEQFKRITTQLKEYGVKSIELGGGGEPLLHPDIEKIINWIVNKLHLHLGIITNGSMLYYKPLCCLIADKADYIRVSLYENSYNSVIKKVEKLIQIKEAINGKATIGIKFLADQNNQNFILSAIKQSVLIPGINHISVKAKRGDSQIFDYSVLQKQINDLHDERICVNLNKTILTEKCWLSPIHTMIDPKGNVYICCYYMDREKEHCIGNILEKDFDQIWGSQEHLSKLNHINPHKCNIYDCRWHNYNKDMSEFLNNVHHQFC